MKVEEEKSLVAQNLDNKSAAIEDHTQHFGQKALVQKALDLTNACCIKLIQYASLIMVNYLGFTLIKLPNNQRYNKMTILKLFHKTKSTICLLVVAPEIRAWAPRRRKKYNFLSFCGSPFSKDPTNPCPGFSSEFINYYHRFYKPPPPLPSPPYRLQFSA